MAYCSQCGTEYPSDARFCRNCGTANQSELSQSPLSIQELTHDSHSGDWLCLDDVIHTRDRLIGGIGAILVLIGAFTPWVNVKMLWGLMSQNTASPIAWLCVLGAIGSGTFLFRKQSGTIVMITGVALAALTLIIALGNMSNNASLSWGVLFTLAGGGMVGYSGYLTRQYEQG